MIPKTIHYCWFGGNPLPKTARRCIDSWHRFFPDYEIKEWNETNFDVNCIPYTRDAYASKKYAFVSDYARFLILYEFGGVYFDTDVEVIKPMEDILESGPFMGTEVPSMGANPIVAPGLGLGLPPGHCFSREICDIYEGLPFRDAEGSINKYTVVPITTDILVQRGLKPVNELQEVEGVWVYPVDYFNPLDSVTGRLKLTDNTRTIHWYMDSWSDRSRLYKLCSRLSHRLFGMFFNRIKTSFGSF